MSADLPEPVRYSLSVLALYMNPNGTHGRPGFQKFTGARRVSEKTLQRHLEAAIAGGWLALAQRGGRNGDGSTRANSYAASIPGGIYPRLNEILGPVWGDMPLPTGQSQPDMHGRPVEAEPPCPVEDLEQSQPDIPECLVEDFSTGHLDISTGHSITSTGHAACPPTDHSHRPTTPISQSAQDLEGVRWLHSRGYGLTDPEALIVIKEARRRAATEIEYLAAYLNRMAENGELLDLVEAVQLAGKKSGGYSDERTYEPEGVRPAEPAFSVTSTKSGCDQHPGGPVDPLPVEGWGDCLTCNNNRRMAEPGLPRQALLDALKADVAAKSAASRVTRKAPAVVREPLHLDPKTIAAREAVAAAEGFQPLAEPGEERASA